jgi:hypothetical protein
MTAQQHQGKPSAKPANSNSTAKSAGPAAKPPLPKSKPAAHPHASATHDPKVLSGLSVTGRQMTLGTQQQAVSSSSTTPERVSGQQPAAAAVQSNTAPAAMDVDAVLSTTAQRTDSQV